MMLRQDQLCPGPLDCETAETARCTQCGHEWFVEDSNCLGKCPQCEDDEPTIKRCATCPLNKLDTIRRTTDAGLLIDRVLNLEFSIEKLHLTWEDINAEEAATFRIITEERLEARQEEDEDRRMQAGQKVAINR
jgi:predicted RNA-binding Zn-ribbon protein involved in translation (DUF1610 family)